MQACERLLPLLPAAASPASPSVMAPTARTAAVPEGPSAGPLSGVPALPPAYVVRNELPGLIAAVGLVGPAVGVHGQGGIGKSVLAAALAHDDGVRRRFPDGVYWVTVGGPDNRPTSVSWPSRRPTDAVFAAVGHTPPGVALVAAAVASGRAWADLAAELARDVFGDHPSANVFKAMQVAVRALPPDLAAAVLDLAVFPTDTAVPITAVARLWAQTRGIDPAQTAADLDRLALAGVLQRESDGIGFHDLQHDYLVLHAPPLAGLHAALVAAYRAVVPAEPSPWWRLPDGEPYVFDHIVTHLARRVTEPPSPPP